MGELKSFIQQLSESENEKKHKENAKKAIDNIVNKMASIAKTQKFYHWVGSNTDSQYYNEIYNFFKEEGFCLTDYQKQEVDSKGNIIRDRSFYIRW